MTRICLGVLLSLALFLACSAPNAGREPASAAGSPAASAAVIGPGGAAIAVSPPSTDGEGPVPIHPDDARLGPDSAEVTIVTVTDLQCPFCARADGTLRELRRRYGPRLRFVVKHLPLDFHPMARPAALAAIRVQRRHGDAAFFRFVATVLANQASLGDDALGRWESAVRDPEAPRRTFEGSPEEQIARDIAWADEHRIYGTPNFLVNGRRILGAQPLEAFVAIIEREFADIAAARAEGKPVRYPDRASQNYEAPPRIARDADEGRIYDVPVGKSPVWGTADALVTIVEFSDYQCPFCKRAQGTVEQLQQRYGTDLRVVFKHQPLSFHDRSGPAAGLALEAYRERGNEAFWQASRSLFAAPGEALTDAGLESLGKALGLDPKKVREAVKLAERDPAILDDMRLARDVGAEATPTFFVNGQKIRGAQPLAVFEEAVDAQLAAARAMVKAGAARSEVYDRIMKLAQERPGAPSD